MSMSYPARTAFFCSSILLRSRSVILRLTVLMAFDLIHRLDVQADDQAAFHIQKIRQHTVIQLRGENLQEADGPVLLTHAELLAGAELEAGRAR